MQTGRHLPTTRNINQNVTSWRVSFARKSVCVLIMNQSIKRKHYDGISKLQRKKYN